MNNWTTEENRRFRRIGAYLGYPKCCITSFIRRGWRGLDKLNEDQHQAHGGTGFIPCQKCARKVMKGASLHQLLQGRQCPAPFPKARYKHIKDL